MKSIYATALLAILVAPNHVLASADEECPRTIASGEFLASPFPKSDSWYGSESLAVILPDYGILPTTKPRAQITMKLFWWSMGFKPGMESNLKVEVKNFLGGPNDARVTRTTNANADSLGGWTMLVGLDLPSPGCWQITGTYLGQTLTFVLESVAHDKYLPNAA